MRKKMRKPRSYKAACRYYGLQPLSGKENISKNQELVRQCKIDVVNACRQMRVGVDAIEAMIKSTPEEGDEEYIEAVVKFRSQANELCNLMEEMVVHDEDKNTIDQNITRTKEEVMSLPLTVSELKYACDELIRKGHGERAILLSNDTEETGFHGMYYGLNLLEDSGTYVTLN